MVKLFEDVTSFFEIDCILTFQSRAFDPPFLGLVKE